VFEGFLASFQVLSKFSPRVCFSPTVAKTTIVA
jgi:hypothetical protein